ncbi:MAG: nitroreductase family protein [Candidatus Heimdallarchaeota archaeon]
MPIVGINYEKCTQCGLCSKECRWLFVKQENKVIFEDINGRCNLCGHCIAVCPSEAIIFENLGDDPFYFEGIEDLENYIPYETISNFLRANRSIRHYKDKPVPKSTLEKVIRVMEFAPTGANVRAEKIAIISDSVQLSTLSEGIIGELLKNPSIKSRSGEHFETLRKIYKHPIFHDAPHIIIVSSLGNSPLDHFNIGNIVTYGRIAAQSLGLGTCYIGYAQIAFESNPKLLKIAKIVGKSWGVITIGYPDIEFMRCPPRSHKKVKGL